MQSTEMGGHHEPHYRGPGGGALRAPIKLSLRYVVSMKVISRRINPSTSQEGGGGRGIHCRSRNLRDVFSLELIFP